MSETVIGVLHPGEMGAAVAGCLTGRGFEVGWVPAGRSPVTAGRAAAAGLTGVLTVSELAARADFILSICPPHAALATARAVAGAPGGFPGIFVDANAISPGTARQVRAVVEQAGASYVDGGIIGLPRRRPGAPGSTCPARRRARSRACSPAPALDARVIGVQPGSVAASAVKMAYAGWTKGSAALLLAVRGLARAEGVEDVLLAEWGSPSRRWPAGRPGRRSRRRPRAGAGPGRWRRSLRAWPRPGCPVVSTWRRPTSSAAPGTAPRVAPSRSSG